LHERHRLAILNLGAQSWWSHELAEVEARNHPSKPKSGFLGTPAQLQRSAGGIQGVAAVYGCALSARTSSKVFDVDFAEC
jgi:hypothetical protein